MLNPLEVAKGIKKAMDTMSGAETRRRWSDFERATKRVRDEFMKASPDRRSELKKEMEEIVRKHAEVVGDTYDNILLDARKRKEAKKADQYEESLSGMRRKDLQEEAKSLGVTARGTSAQIARNIAAEQARRDVGVSSPANDERANALETKAASGTLRKNILMPNIDQLPCEPDANMGSSTLMEVHFSKRTVKTVLAASIIVSVAIVCGFALSMQRHVPFHDGERTLVLDTWTGTVFGFTHDFVVLPKSFVFDNADPKTKSQ